MVSVNNTEQFDRVIIGAGLYGLYSALFCGKQGLSVLVLEMEDAPFMRATYINQARVHMGYHYPRSLTTALKSAGYFRRFVDDFGFCIHQKFDQVYATSANFSWTGRAQFMEFCKAAGIRCDEVSVEQYFREGMCDGAFLTEEYTYDAHVLRDYLLQEIGKYQNIRLSFGSHITGIERGQDHYLVTYTHEETGDISRGALSQHAGRVRPPFSAKTPFVLNATYASVNQILHRVFPEDLFKIKYELCEIILCEPSKRLENIGITVMDGPFFSIMPFGLTGLHSLTSVSFTPHVTSYEDRPTFKCQQALQKYNNGLQGQYGGRMQDTEIDANLFLCDSECLNNCNACPMKPESAWPHMSHLANKYLKPEYAYTYKDSLFSMKPILKSSEIDDSRPTAILVHSGGKKPGSGACELAEPTFISVLSGKINTVYDLEEYLI